MSTFVNNLHDCFFFFFPLPLSIICTCMGVCVCLWLWILFRCLKTCLFSVLCTSKASWKRSSRTSRVCATSCWRTNPRPQRSSLHSFRNSVKKCTCHNLSVGQRACPEQTWHRILSCLRWDDYSVQTCCRWNSDPVFVVNHHNKPGVSVCQG